MNREAPLDEHTPGMRARWLVGLATYLIAFLLFAIAAADWAWPWAAAVRLLDQAYPGNLRYCVSQQSSPARVTRSYILVPESFKQVSVFEVVQEESLPPAVRSSSWGRLVIFLYFNLAVFLALLDRVAADVLALSSVPFQSPVQWCREGFYVVVRSWKSLGIQERVAWDSRLLFAFIASMAILSLLGTALSLPLVILVVLLIVVALVIIAVRRKRRRGWKRTPVTKLGAVGVVLNLAIGVAFFNEIPAALLVFDPTHVPYLLAFVALFVFSALSCLGLID